MGNSESVNIYFHTDKHVSLIKRHLNGRITTWRIRKSGVPPEAVRGSGKEAAGWCYLPRVTPQPCGEGDTIPGPLTSPTLRLRGGGKSSCGSRSYLHRGGNETKAILGMDRKLPTVLLQAAAVSCFQLHGDSGPLSILKEAAPGVRWAHPSWWAILVGGLSW